MSTIDKSKSPYFDDFSIDKKYHEILYRPKRAVQTRELNQIQSMFNEQIKRLGDHTFEDGSVVIPGESNYDLELDYVTLTISNYNNIIGLLGSSSISLRSNNGITAKSKIFKEVDGTDPATFYIGYGDSSTDYVFTKFQTGTILEIILDNNVIGTATVISTGFGSKFTINNGVYYINGRFVLVEEQTVLLDKYSNTPSKIVGIEYNETIVTESDDSSLFDNAQGTPNFLAPGAHRLRVDTSLKVFDISESETIPKNIVEIFRIEAGKIQKKYRGPDYNILGDVLAQRTYEESGDYAVKSFNIGFEEIDDTTFNVSLDSGIAYVRGYRIETSSKVNVISNKARETGILNNSSISAALGYYVDIENLSTLPNTSALQSIYINNINDIVLGTARIRFIHETTAGKYRLYLFDIRDDNGVKSTSFMSSATNITSTDIVNFTCDIVDPVIKDASNNSLMFPLNVTNVKTLNTLVGGQSDTSYSSVKQMSGTLDSNGQITFTTNSSETFVTQDARYAIGVYTDNDTFFDTAGNHTLGGNPLGSILTIGLGIGNAGRPVRVNLQIAKEQVVQKTKTINTSSITGSLVNGLLSLGKADVYEIVSVLDNDSNDITSLFTLNNNKTKSFYNISNVTTSNTIVDPITVQFKYFSHSSGDYFGPDSYVGIDYEDIPTEDGVRLSDVLDFRPRINDSGTGFSGTGSSVGNIPTPFTIIRSDIEHYLPRIDKIYVKSDGTFGITEGVADLDPKEPANPAESMVLFKLSIPAYTFDLKDIQAEKINNRRYTMRDIGQLENRLSNVEYYVALNNLELEADSAQSLDPITGANRFKNGFLTDQFINHSVGDFGWENYHTSVSPGSGELQPEFSLNAVDLEYNSIDSFNVVNNNGMVTLPFTHNSFVRQNQRSSFINVNPYAVFRWDGNLKLVPEVDSWIDTVYANPDVTYKEFNNGELTQTWNSWQLNWTGESSTVTSAKASGSFIITTSITTKTNVDVVNDRVIDTSVTPYMRTIDISINGKGNRPNTKMYFFFDNVDINQYVKPVFGSFGSNIITDDEGNFDAIFRIPNSDTKRFRTGNKQILATDNPVNNRELSTSSAEAMFSSTGNRNLRQQTIVATRNINSSSKTTWRDPIAQSFLVERSGGIFVTKIDIFFKSKDDRVPISVQLREMENGRPTQRLIPGGEKMLLPSGVETSNDGSIPTSFVFDYPIYLKDGIEYCFVLTSNSNLYNAFIATLGDIDINNNRYITKQPYAGVMFKSQNNSTWTEDQQSDLQFEIFSAKFDTSVTGNLFSYNKDFEKIILPSNPILTTLGESTLTIKRKGHNYVVGTIINLSDASIGNGFVLADINDIGLPVVEIVDPNTFKVETGVTATATGYIGGSSVLLSNTIQASIINPNIPTIELPGTNIQFELKGTSGKSLSGLETPYNSFTNYIKVSNNNINELKQPWMITNRLDETTNLSGNKSITLKATLSSNNENISPLIDLTGANLITPFYQVDSNPSIDPEGLNNWANYRTKISSLKQAADMIRVLVDIKRSEGSSIVISARVGNTTEEVDEATWFEIPNISGMSNISNTQYYENEFEITRVQQFTQYQIMIQLKSTSAVSVPKCARLRVLTLSDFS